MERERERERAPIIVFTFDDYYFDSWLEHAHIFKELHAKPTLFLSNYLSWKEKDHEIIKVLQLQGFHFGYHGKRHINIHEHLAEGGTIKSYLELEIVPGLSYLDSLGIDANAYAHPYGQTVPELCKKLSGLFSSCRGMSHPPRKKASVIINKALQNYPSMCIDSFYTNNQFTCIEPYLSAIKEKHSAIILTAHRIGGSSPWSVSPKLLQKIISYAEEQGIEISNYAALDRQLGRSN